MSSGYVIQVGHYAPQKVIIAVPVKGTGEPSPDYREAWNGGGTHNIINRARVWGRRVLDDGKLQKINGEESVVEVTTKDYHGKLEFLKWGDPKLGAQAIDIRYLPQSMSLDVQYQDNIQKITIDPEGKDNNTFIELSAGENKFDYKTQALFIQMLQVHPQNRDSKSKNDNPNIKGYSFVEVTDETSDGESIKQQEAQLTAGSFVMSISQKAGAVKNLLDVFLKQKVEFGDVNDLSLEKDKYNALLKFAREKSGDFGFFINEYKKKISDAFVKAKNYNALDLTKIGVIGLIVDNKKEILIEGVEGKEEEMLDWVLANFLDEKVYERTQHLFSQCSKLK